MILEGVIPPIIDKDIWEKVQKRMKSHKRGTNKAKREYWLTGLIECAECGAAYVGHCSVNRRKDGSLRENRYYECGNKYRTHTCKSRNINADELELFVVSQIRDALNTWDFRAIAKEYAALLNSGAPDCTAEKRELADIERQIANGVKAMLSGLSVPELSAEIDRLRQRKLDLESVIAAKQQSSSHIYTPEEIHGALLCLLHDFEPSNAVRALVQKIYANADGSCTVHIGVHIPWLR